MLSNAYFLAKFRFDTAENEPAKNLPNFAKFANFANPNPRSSAAARPEPRSRGKDANLGVRPEGGRRRRAALADGRAGEAAGARLQRHLPTIQFGKIHKFCQLLPNFRSARSQLYRNRFLKVNTR